jgi:pimeloyl-ACP methyl ester carboxylesterase
MTPHDDDLSRFEAQGAAPLPVADEQSYVEHDGARIWYASYGSGAPVILLHGGLGNSRNWGYQLPALLANGHRAIVIDSRGHGRSTRDARPYTYEPMAADVLAVMDALRIDRAAMVGWSDGATIALILAMQVPARVAGVFFFGCTMDPANVKPFDDANPVIGRCFRRHAKDYAELSPTPGQFREFVDAVSLMMRTEPHYSPAELARIDVPVWVVQSEHDEFIRREDSASLASTLPNARLLELNGVSHFAPLQRPDEFNEAMLSFVRSVLP